jgi:hypothetical protein
MSHDDIVPGHPYPQGEDFCTENNDDGEVCGIPLSSHRLGQSETTGR